jgi:succinyl-diaminopimelate desuccinylase
VTGHRTTPSEGLSQPPETTARRLAELTLELCSIPSETGQEAAIAGFVESRCREALGSGGAVRRVGNSVICEPPGVAPPGAPVIALVGHLDTVKCALDQPNEIREGRVYGCGASDMKGGVAVMLALLDEWRALTARYRVVWLFYDKEEGLAEENGLEAVLADPELPSIDFAFILEPTDRALQFGSVGVLHATVTVRGRRAHSARPWQGENALYRAIPLLERLEAFGRREVTIDGLDFYEVLVATQASTVNSKNVVPDVLHLNLNYRFAPGKSIARAERELRDWVGDAGEVEIIDRAPSGAVHVEHPLLDAWRRAEGLEAQPKQAWTDVARFTERGVPAVNFGPGETSQAHQAGEWCSVDSLTHNHAALRRFFL